MTSFFSQRLRILRKAIAALERNLSALMSTSQGPPPNLEGNKRMTERVDFNKVPCGTFNGNDLALGLAGHLPGFLTTYPDIFLVKEGAMYTYGWPDLPLKPFLKSKDAVHPLAVLSGNYDKLSTARQRMEKMLNEMRFSPLVPASMKLEHEMRELLDGKKR